MKIHEYQAKEIFSKYGIPVERHTLCRTAAGVVAAYRSVGADRVSIPLFARLRKGNALRRKLVHPQDWVREARKRYVVSERRVTACGRQEFAVPTAWGQKGRHLRFLPFYLCRLSKSCGCSQFAIENGLRGTVILQSTLSCPSGNSPCAAPCVE